MKIELTHKESEDIFHGALCNGIGYIGGYGLSLDYSKEDYQKAKGSLQSKLGEDAFICREDVWLEILKTGGTLSLKDLEGDEDSTISLKEVHERVSKTPTQHLMDYLNERDDAVTADCILQSVFYEEVIFG